MRFDYQISLKSPPPPLTLLAGSAFDLINLRNKLFALQGLITQFGPTCRGEVSSSAEFPYATLTERFRI